MWTAIVSAVASIASGLYSFFSAKKSGENEYRQAMSIINTNDDFLDVIDRIFYVQRQFVSVDFFMIGFVEKKDKNRYSNGIFDLDFFQKYRKALFSNNPNFHTYCNAYLLDVKSGRYIDRLYTYLYENNLLSFLDCSKPAYQSIFDCIMKLCENGIIVPFALPIYTGDDEGHNFLDGCSGYKLDLNKVQNGASVLSPVFPCRVPAYNEHLRKFLPSHISEASAYFNGETNSLWRKFLISKVGKGYWTASRDELISNSFGIDEYFPMCIFGSMFFVSSAPNLFNSSISGYAGIVGNRTDWTPSVNTVPFHSSEVLALTTSLYVERFASDPYKAYFKVGESGESAGFETDDRNRAVIVGGKVQYGAKYIDYRKVAFFIGVLVLGLIIKNNKKNGKV